MKRIDELRFLIGKKEFKMNRKRGIYSRFFHENLFLPRNARKTQKDGNSVNNGKSVNDSVKE